MKHHHKHIHPGRPSSIFFTPRQVLDMLNIREGGYLLDAGCGDGFISIAASKLVGESGKVFAVDVDGNSIESLKKEIEQNYIKNIEPMQADISKNLPLEDNFIDICLMVNVFHGLVENEESEMALKEIKRVVKDNGRFAVIEFKKMDSFPGPPESVRLTPEQVQSILEVYDFMNQDFFEIGPYHYGMIFGNL
ncbi:MAG: class I SAM-dependent methyltransferase [Thermoplasmata archaeon]